MHDDDARDPAWADVRGRNELRGEAKLAWWYLWHKCRRRPDTVWVSHVEIAHDQGAADARSGSNALDQLTEKRFVEEIERAPGRRRLFVKQPQDVLRPVESRGFTDEQQSTLFDQRDGQAAAEDPSTRAAQRAQHPPADPARDPPTPPCPLESRAHRPYPYPSNLRNEGHAQIYHSTGAHAAAERAQHPPAEQGPQPIASAILAALERRPGDELPAVERIARIIWQRVNDQNLNAQAVEFVARAVVDGTYPAKQLGIILAWVDDQHKAHPLKKRWGLFIGGCGTSYERHRPPHADAWPFKSKRRRYRDVDAEATREA